jgi:hypothetical protein
MRRGAHRRFMLVVGPSGCGKSSLERAGVLPRLTRERDWLVLEPLIPDELPFNRLARLLEREFQRFQLRRPWSDICGALEQGAEDSSWDSLIEIADDMRQAAGQPDSKLLISVDQFEQLLGRPDRSAHSRFLRLLRRWAEQRDRPVFRSCQPPVRFFRGIFERSSNRSSDEGRDLPSCHV